MRILLKILIYFALVLAATAFSLNWTRENRTLTELVIGLAIFATALGFTGILLREARKASEN